MTLQIRRGTNTQREQLTNSNPVLAGELLYVTDQQALYIGTGESGDEQGVLIASNTAASVVQLTTADIASVITEGIKTNIVFIYNPSTGKVNSSIDLSVYDGEISAATLRGNVIAEDSTLLINTSTGQIVGDINAKLGGDLDLNSYDITGTGNVSASEILTSQLTIDSTIIISDANNGRATIKVRSPSSTSVVKLTRTATTDISSDNTIVYGSIYFERDDPVNNALTTCIISGGNNFIKFTTISAGEYQDINTVALVSGNLGVGNVAPAEKLDVTGNALISGNLGVGNVAPAEKLDVTGNALISGNLGVGNVAPAEKLDVTGNALISGFVKTGSFTDTSRDALTPAVGMIIYNTTLNKFQGYQNTDGTTLEWVNLS